MRNTYHCDLGLCHASLGVLIDIIGEQNSEWQKSHGREISQTSPIDSKLRTPKTLFTFIPEKESVATYRICLLIGCQLELTNTTANATCGAKSLGLFIRWNSKSGQVSELLFSFSIAYIKFTGVLVGSNWQFTSGQISREKQKNILCRFSGEWVSPDVAAGRRASRFVWIPSSIYRF